MRTTFIISTLLSLSFIACDQQKEADVAVVGDEQEVITAQSDQTFVVDTTDSKVVFQGNGVGKNHRGSFTIDSGAVSISDGELTGGTFNINIQSLDLEEEGKMIDEKLYPHLLSDDFFGVQNYPDARFELTSIKPFTPGQEDSSYVQGANYMISGNLTLRDQTRNVSFPAKVDIDENKVTAEADFNINRKDWAMTYGADKSLGDKFISETVNIELDLVAEADND